MAGVYGAFKGKLSLSVFLAVRTNPFDPAASPSSRGKVRLLKSVLRDEFRISENQEKCLVKSFLLLLIAFTSLTAGTAFAETVSFQKEYTYQAGELDNKGSARIIAMENAKRLLFGEVEAYL